MYAIAAHALAAPVMSSLIKITDIFTSNYGYHRYPEILFVLITTLKLQLLYPLLGLILYCIY